ncbi:aspartate aminotransferase family protein [Amphritea pacifica]|uniref:Aminotransferase class III-fold pyridoxal phosphate-dependent enzyme n=1 Tax=Amphritea pacifica TaxID=2811233 RepID=A0ABS2W800_9GAMM|nr:aminotransferase class III-fold pyridoxal phosphate-dependent enzyme [Amphritea pacifica]MBN0987642.1 aminotransferase class III-fold pyridoxal phosphate-dependent enzyme [Amphritea pacifica]MBN1009056.1 aminotransferase class III-fold pyridoxal phosphate-dependent enzyme [Amphritea pacifica]
MNAPKTISPQGSVELTAENPQLTPAISEWPDVDDLYRRFDNLVNQPMRSIRRDAMSKVLGYFDERCQTSKRLAEEAKQVIPGGVQHNLSFNYPFPLAMKEAKGAHLTDVDGNRYIDFLQAGGPTLLGSNPPELREKVNELLDQCGPVTGLLHEYEAKLAELVCNSMPGVDMVRLLGSGTEAVMGAVRLARTYTKKKWIIKIGGAYHGWSDQLVYGMRLPSTGRMEAIGIPRGATAHTQECLPNDLDALRRKLQMNRLRGGTAAVMVEPLGPESGTRPVHPDYNRQLRKLCDEFGALLIFDEVVTGFRMGPGGAQAYFGVKPDITVLGKCLAGGYPMAGAIGGRRDVMMMLVGGIGTTSRRAFVGGTLSANPLSCVAGYHALLEAQKQDAAGKAGRAGDRLRRGLAEIIERRGLPYVVYNMGSIVHLQTSGVLLLDTSNLYKLWRVKNEAKERKHMMEEMGAAYSAHGLITLAGSRIYTSLADTDEVIDEALNRFDDVFNLV